MIYNNNMLYNVKLASKVRGEDSNVWLAVEARSMGEAEAKALREYPDRRIYEIGESHYDAIIK